MEASIDVMVSIPPRKLGKKAISKWDIVDKVKKQKEKNIPSLAGFIPGFSYILRHSKQLLAAAAAAAAAAAKPCQLCLTLCDPIDRRPPGSSVLGILQARTLEWAKQLLSTCISAFGPERNWSKGVLIFCLLLIVWFPEVFKSPLPPL